MKYKLVIGWLYPELMSTYGDRGNIIALQKRCEWRKIETETKHFDVGFDYKELATCDLLFMGGAQDRQQKIVSDDLKKDKSNALKQLIEKEIPGLFICGAYQFLGKYYKEADGTIIEGLGILDVYTVNPGINKKRLIGDVIAKLSIPNYQFSEKSIVGFENHGGRTYLGKNVDPLAEVIVGFGNNGGESSIQNNKTVLEGDKTEGALYKNSIGTYFHGPILPKNPHLADFLIEKALEIKYNDKVKLKDLDDSLEWTAHKSIANTYNIKI